MTMRNSINMTDLFVYSMESAGVEPASEHIATQISTFIDLLFEFHLLKRHKSRHPQQANLISLFSPLQVGANCVSPFNLGPRSNPWAKLGGSTLSAY